MHMYHTEKLDMPEYFRSELSQFMSVISRNFVQYMHNMGNQFDVGWPPLYFPIYTQMGKTLYSSPNTEHVFPGPSLPWNGH